MSQRSDTKLLVALLDDLKKSTYQSRLTPTLSCLSSKNHLAGYDVIAAHKWTPLAANISLLLATVKKWNWKPSSAFVTSLQDLSKSLALEELFLNDSILDIQANAALYQPTIELLHVFAGRDATRNAIFTPTLLARIQEIKLLYSNLQFKALDKAVEDDCELHTSFTRLWTILDSQEAMGGESSVGGEDDVSQIQQAEVKKTSLRTTPFRTIATYAKAIAKYGTPKVSTRSKSGMKTATGKTEVPKEQTSVGSAMEDSAVASASALKELPPVEDPVVEGKASVLASPPTEAPAVEDPASAYASALKELQFGEADLKLDHSYLSQPSQKTAAVIKRICQELLSLSKNLPLHPDGSIFLRYDSERVDLMRAMITGPKGTPYEHGCFIFDIYIPASFPSAPPQVLFLTGSKSGLRFNPNLYDSGFVCLSLINTWNGSAAEHWNPQSSTLLQVLVSLQALVLCKDPYFNEPGYETYRSSPKYQAKSDSYSSVVAGYTLTYAMRSWLLRAPCSDFDYISRKHLSLTRPVVLTVTPTFQFDCDTLA